MREWLKQCNDYSDLQAIEDHIYSNFDLLQIFSLIPILNTTAESSCSIIMFN